MNMNDEKWNEFWDNEADEDDEFTDVGSDVDANNDETFDNAAEWNEDEHEELIARDSILSHTIRNTNNHHHHMSNSRTNVNSRISSNNNNINNSTNNSNNNNNNGDDSSSSAFVSNVINSVGRAGWNSLSDKDLFPALERQDQRPTQTTNSETPWQSVKHTSERLHLLQMQQQQLLLQNRLKEQQHHESQQLREQQILQQQRGQPRAQIQLPPSMDMGRQILRVDELESQLLKTRISHNAQSELTNTVEAPKRTGWSPFGGKDLFTTPDSPSQGQSAASKLGQNIMFPGQMPQSLTLDQQQQILMQQQNLLQQHQIQQMTMLKQQQIQQEQRLMSQNPQCFTVEELERQMIPNKSNSSQEVGDSKQHHSLLAREEIPKSRKPNDKHEKRVDNFDQRSDRFDRNEGDIREAREHRDRRDRRDHREYREHREYRNMRDHRNNKSKKLTIIPSQVQLSVLEKAKRFHSLTAMHADEFLQDRMPTTKDGLLFKRHSTVMREKVNHDGVLTERERNWLTKIQQKIQADYDDNMDQDYYYLLYFNRSSMTDEASQKPCGPGVLDRRFIPRERLLYNSSA